MRKQLIILSAWLSIVVNTAWAAGPKETVSATIKVGESTPVYSFKYKTPAEDRWWKLVVDGTADDSSTAQFENALEGKPYRSAEHSTEAKFHFTGVKPGKQTWRIYWTSPYDPDKSVVPEDNPLDHEGSAGYPSGSDVWASKDKYYVLYEITVTGDDDPPEEPTDEPVETVYKDCTITTVGATVDATTAPDELILIYTNTAVTGSLVLPTNVTARVLVVGGGGSGSSGVDSSMSSKRKGSGGGGGVVVSDPNFAFPAGAYEIVVGKGGESVTCTSSSTMAEGQRGTASSVRGEGIDPLVANGGDKGPAEAEKSGSNVNVTTNDITGVGKEYAAGGAACSSSSNAGKNGSAATGNGGQGGGKSKASGAGGSGIVVVRITGLVEATPDPGPDDPPVDPPVVTAPKFCITPYLQRPTSDGMTLIYFTDSACVSTAEVWLAGAVAEAATVRMETTVGEWAQALTNNAYQLDKGEEKNKWNNSLYRHRVRFEGLEANRVYNYTVTLGDGGVAYTNTFRTAPDRNTPIRFVSYADCETKQSQHFPNYTANLLRMQSRQPDLITTSGDLAARGGIQSHWDEFWSQNAGEYTDVLGSIPMITAIGNHDLFDNVKHSASYWYHDAQGEFATEKFLSYFEFNSNHVAYAYRDRVTDENGQRIPETRDMSQLFHREDYGPVTLIFLDTNNGDDTDPSRDTNWCSDSNSYHEPGGMNRAKGARHPDFNPGSPQYDWLTNNLADAQAKSRFTFVFNHHCPYSAGSHNEPPGTSKDEDASAVPVRVLTETMVRYGVDGWYCGHDEYLEHAITNGWEILPNGQRRRHTLSIYDLGCSGDSDVRGSSKMPPLGYWIGGSNNYGGTGKYGFLETDVTTNRNGRWTCTITPIQGSTGNAVTNNGVGAQIVYVENPDRGEEENDLVYAEAANADNPIDGASQTKPSDWVAWEKPPEGPGQEVTPQLTPFEVLRRGAMSGGATNLEADLEFPSDGVLLVPAGQEFVLDLKGHAIIAHADGAIVNRGKLTVIDSTKAGPLQAHLAYSAAELGAGRTLVRNEGELVIDGVFVDGGVVNGADSEFRSGNTAIAATAGSVTVKNGAHVGGQTAIEATGDVAVEISDAHLAGWRGAVAEAATVRKAEAVAEAATVRWDSTSTLLISNATLEAEGRLLRTVAASATVPSSVSIVDSTLATSRTAAPFDLASGVSVTLERSIYVDRWASWFPVTTALANEGADLKVGAGCLLAVASEGVIGFLDEDVTAGQVATRVWRTAGKDDDEPLPPLTPEEESKIAEVLSSSPDAALKANITTIEDYTAYKAWVDGKVESGDIASEAAAKGAEGSFFSFATDQKELVNLEAITEEKVEVKEMEVSDGGVKLTVGIKDLPVGESAQAKYLEKVFGVTGTAALDESFAAEKVTYKKDMTNNGDGTVSYSAEPKVEAGEAKPGAFFFKATVTK